MSAFWSGKVNSFNLILCLNLCRYEQCVTFDSFPTKAHEISYAAFGMLMMYVVPLAVFVFTYSSILCEISRRSQEGESPKRSRGRDMIVETNGINGTPILFVFHFENSRTRRRHSSDDCRYNGKSTHKNCQNDSCNHFRFHLLLDTLLHHEHLVTYKLFFRPPLYFVCCSHDRLSRGFRENKLAL